jgi:hypothetical protein
LLSQVAPPLAKLEPPSLVDRFPHHVSHVSAKFGLLPVIVRVGHRRLCIRKDRDGCEFRPGTVAPGLSGRFPAAPGQGPSADLRERLPRLQLALGMIPKSGHRFSEKIMLQ